MMGLFDRRQPVDETGEVLPTHNTTHTTHTSPTTAHTADPRRSSATYPVGYEPGVTHSYSTGDDTYNERDGIGHPITGRPGHTTGVETAAVGNAHMREKTSSRVKGGGIRGLLHNLTFREGDPYGRRPTVKEWWQMYWHDFLM